MTMRKACCSALTATWLLVAGAVAATEPDERAAGRRVYDAQRCATCHSIAGKGNPRHPLDDVGGRLSRDDIRRWIVAPQEMRPGVVKRSYKLPDADLDALVDYLASLRQ